MSLNCFILLFRYLFASILTVTFAHHRDLVSHLNSSFVATDKLRSIQKVLDPNCVPLKCCQVVATRWWSTSMLIDSVVALKRPLIALFRNKFREHESPNTPTALESLELTEDNFLGLQDIQHILSPFKDTRLKILHFKFYKKIKNIFLYFYPSTVSIFSVGDA